MHTRTDSPVTQRSGCTSRPRARQKRRSSHEIQYALFCIARDPDRPRPHGPVGAQYVIETFFPDVTLVDLGAFYAMGLISGLATGIWWGRSRRTEGQG